MATAEALASLLRERGPAVALTGAGMSTDSGIPDFRSAGGLWEGVDPYEVASIDAFRRDPLRVWRWYGERVGMLASAVPNAGHLALAELERDGHVRTVATQNIDALHTRAGSADVVELHGSIRRFDCLACGAVETLDAVLAQLAESPAPTCEASEYKLYATELSKRVADASMDVAGPGSQLRVRTADAPMQGRAESTYRYTVIDTIGGGASEIQKNIIARRKLGLPKNF